MPAVRLRTEWLTFMEHVAGLRCKWLGAGARLPGVCQLSRRPRSELHSVVASELPKFCGLPPTASSPPDLTVGPHPWQRTGPGNATDGKLKFDLSKFDQTYFDRLRTRVQALKDAGIYAGIYLFTGEWLAAFRCSSDGYPFTGVNNVNGVDDGGGVELDHHDHSERDYGLSGRVRREGDRHIDLPNVLWITSEEAPSNSTWWNTHQISHIRSYESGKAYQHPIGYGVLSNNDDSILINSNADWMTPAARLSPTTVVFGNTEMQSQHQRF